ncbi:RTX calcium-binding nonapeptide repeat [Burkholderiaceae bacterium]
MAVFKNIQNFVGAYLSPGDEVTGTAGGDALIGGEGRDTLFGMDGNDYLMSRAGGGVLDGGNGNDTLIGGSGNDLLIGGLGEDKAVYNIHTDNEFYGIGTVSGGGVRVNLMTGIAIDGLGGQDELRGIEQVVGSRYDDILVGDANNNSLYGAAGDDWIDGGAGDDWLNGALGNDLIVGGDGVDWAGYDTYTFDGSAPTAGISVAVTNSGFVVSDGNGGTDTLLGVENISGSYFDDSLQGDAFGNKLYGSLGADTIDGGAGDDTLSGDEGNDLIRGGEGNDLVVFYNGKISVALSGGAGIVDQGWRGLDTLSSIENITGSYEDDVISIGDVSIGGAIGGRAGNDLLIGGSGNNYITGGSGADTIDGGAGSDTANYSYEAYDNSGSLSVTGLGVVVNLATGTATDNWGNQDVLRNIEQVTGSQYADSLVGDANNNNLTGGFGDDTFDGGAGDDWLRGDEGNDLINGGAGNDRAYYGWNGTSGISVSLVNGSGIVTGGLGTDTLNSIENIDGSFFDDVISIGDTSIGGGIDGRAGNDLLTGGNGNNYIAGGSGADTIDGGAGSDTVSYSNEAYDNNGSISVMGRGVFVNLANGIATDNWGNQDVLRNIELVQGSQYADSLVGDANNNTLTGGSGSDTLDGGVGNDYLDAGNGDDLLVGGAGNDSLHGGAGADTLLGGEGDDWLKGQDGNDLIDGGAGNDRVGYDWDGASGISVSLVNGSGVVTGGFGADTLISIENVSGSFFDDVISIGDTSIGGSIGGLAGNDILTGGSGNNFMTGGSGADTIDGGAGWDTADYGNEAYDNSGTLSVTGRGVVVNLATGTATDNWGNQDVLRNVEQVQGSQYGDSLVGDANNNNLTGGSGADSLYGGSGNDSLYGGTDNDTIDGGEGNDWLKGELGNDLISGGAGSDWAGYDGTGPTSGVSVSLVNGAGIVTGGLGTDTLSGIENIAGSYFDDVISLGDTSIGGSLEGRAGNDALTAGSGNNYITGGSGADTIDGGAGSDTANYSQELYDNSGSLSVTGRGVVVNLAAGTAIDNWGNQDVLRNIEQVRGSQYDDSLVGDANNNSLFGGSGNDTLQGGAGGDYLEGGLGNDLIDGGAVLDRIQYNDSNTATYSNATAGVNVNLQTGLATGGDGNDSLISINAVTGSKFNDTLIGDANLGFVNLTGGAGDDLIDGGLIQDRIAYRDIHRATYTDATSSVKVNLGLGVSYGGAGNDTLVNINQTRGSNSADVLVGSDNWYIETFEGGAGNDTLDGGSGDNWARYRASTSAVNVNLKTGIALDGYGTVDTLFNINGTRGSEFNDTLIGGNAAYGTGTADGLEMFNGEGGSDLIDGGQGFDRVTYAGSLASVNVNLGGFSAGVAQDGWGGVDTLVSIEMVVGSRFNDTLTGSADLFVEVFEGLEGNDLIDGGAITDLINFSNSNQVIYSGTLDTGVNVNLTTGLVTGGAGNDTLTNINVVRGSTFADTLQGSTALVFESFEGDTGNDVIDGGVITDIYNQANNNRVSYSQAEGAVSVNLATGLATGADGNDTLSNINQVRGSAFDDTIVGSNNSLIETFEGLAGRDLIDGAGGIDIVSYTKSDAAVNVNLGTGQASDGFGTTDTLTNIEGVLGSKFSDVLIGGNPLNGWQDKDGLEFFIGGEGNDTIDGGVGYDRVDFSTSTAGVNVTLGGQGIGNAQDGLGGTDALLNIEGVKGSTFNDTLTGSDTGAFESFDGREGNDLIDGLGGVDRVDYLEANQAGVSVNLTNNVASVDGFGGTDTLLNIEDVRGSNRFGDLIVGSAVANTLEGMGGNDTLSGEAGDDTLLGGDGNDSLSGGEGKDLLMGGAGANTLAGGSGDDTYVIESALDLITEGLNAGADTVRVNDGTTAGTYTLGSNVENGTLVNLVDYGLNGNSLNNVLIGNAKNNRLNGGGGADTLIGGGGNDTYAVDSLADVVVEGVSAGTDTTQVYIATSNGSYTLTDNVENGVLLNTVAFNLAGNALNNALTGNAQANRLDGGDGNDTLNGLAGNDTMLGGNGDDTYVIDTLTDVVTESANAGTDLVQVAVTTAGGTYILGDNVEQATLTNTVAFNLTGNALDNSLKGNLAANTLIGGAGNDTLDGGTGNDSLMGGADDDTYVIDSTLDVVTEDLNAGTDLVKVAIATAGGTYALGSNIENATLTNTVAYSLAGNELNNLLTGNASANSLSGGLGNDTLNGLAGADTMTGGSGDDTYVVDTLLDVVTEAAAAGNDLVQVAITTVNGTYALGTNFEDATLVNTVAYNLTGNTTNNRLTGNQANNTLDGGAGADTLAGADGDDTYVVDSLLDVVTETVAAGTDLVKVAIATAGGSYSLGANLENATLTNTVAYTLVGNELNNSLVGNAAANTLNGGAGDDTLNGMAGVDTMAGGVGNDTYVIDSTSDSVVEDASAGVDLVQVAVTTASQTYTLTSNVENATLINTVAFNLSGNTLDNVLTGNAASNSLNGGAGNDVLDGGLGIDTLIGGVGNDTFVIDSALDVITEALGGGTDQVNIAAASSGTYTLAANLENATVTTAVAYNVTGNTLNNTLVGNQASNVLSGGVGNDLLDAAGGNDTLAGGVGNDTLIGGDGIDLADYSSASAAITTSFAGMVGTATGGDGTDSLVGIENVSGSGFNDTLSGSDGSNLLIGNAGADLLMGNGGDDTLIGGLGNDILIGGEGTDWVSFDSASATSGVSLALASGGGTASGSEGTDVLSGIENIIGSAFNDTIAGDENNNAFKGGAGNDSLSGIAGNDTLSGGDGNDTLKGGVGYDRILGGLGNDSIDGGAITDRINYTDSNVVDYSEAAGSVAVNLALGTSLGAEGTDSLANINMVVGSRFNDTLTGSSELVFEKFEGGLGDDVLDGGAVTDTFNQLNNNRVSYESASGSVNVNLATGVATGAAGTDTLLNMTQVVGSAFDDVLIGSNSTLRETFMGSAGNDTIDGAGGSGWADVVSYDDAMTGVNVNLATGVAQDGFGTVDTLRNIESVIGSAFADTLIGGNTASGTRTTDGLETFEGGAGNDLIDGGAGYDRVEYTHSTEAVAVTLGGFGIGFAQDGLGGFDTLININAVRGSSFDDTFTGSTDLVYESFEGSEGDDFIDGGAITDIYRNSNINRADYAKSTAAVTVSLAEGTATGGSGSDTLVNINSVRGSSFNDVLTGSTNNVYEYFEGGLGDDTIDGGLVTDTNREVNRNSVTYERAGSAVVVDLSTGIATGGDGTDTLINIQGIRGSKFADVLTGSKTTLSENFEGGAGNDTIYGYAGSYQSAFYTNSDGAVSVNLATGFAEDGYGSIDTLFNINAANGSRFDDTLIGRDTVISTSDAWPKSIDDFFDGGAGNDYIDGRGGFDRVSYLTNPNGVFVTLGGTGVGYATDGYGDTDTLVGIEVVRGSYFDDTLIGSDIKTEERFEGRDGNDFIDGKGGIDSVSYSTSSISGIEVNLGTGVALDGDGGVDTLLNIENVLGSKLFDDVIVGNSANNYLGGDGGNDTLIGADGNDSLMGGAGNDSLLGGAGFDLLQGGVGDDTIDGGLITDRYFNYSDSNKVDYTDASGSVIVDLSIGRARGTSGNDVLRNINQINGSYYNDTLIGSSDLVWEVFAGNAGDDVIDGGLITDTMNLRNSNRVDYSNVSSAVTVNLALGVATGGGGNDTLLNINQVLGSSASDVLIGSDGTIAEMFAGNKGNDTIDGAGGFDVLRYTEAAGAVNVNLVYGTASDGYGTVDTFTNIEGVRGSKYDDVLTGGNTANGVGSTDGLELFMGNAGNDTIDGGAGYDLTDYVSALTAVNVVLGGTGVGTAQDGLGGTDTLINIEAVNGSAFDDTLTGSDSGILESFEGRSGNDVIDGRGGVDRVDYSHSYAGVVVNLSTGVANDGLDGVDTLSNIEVVRGSAFADTLIGSDSSTRETFDGGAGADFIDGRGGIDTVDYSTATDIVYAELASGGGSILPFGPLVQGNGYGFVGLNPSLSEYDILTNIENITGSSFGDILGGSNVDNLLDGAGGDDQLFGYYGNDSLLGGDGNDTIYGGDGDDTLVGGLGINSLSGSSGNDTYVIQSLSDTIIEDNNYYRNTDLVQVNVAIAGAVFSLAAIANVENATLTNSVNFNLIGNDLDNVLTGNAFNNQIQGGAGADTLIGGGGQDTLIGGIGNDTYVLDSANSIITEDLNAGTDLVQVALSTPSGTYTVGDNLENATLINTVAYNLIGNAANNVLVGNAADNTLNGGAGSDTMSGGAGNDRYVVERTTDLVIEDFNSGFDTVEVQIATANSTYTLGANIENGVLINSVAYNLTGNELNNMLTGNSANNSLIGGLGADTLNGGDGVDTLTGGLGDDTYVIDSTTDSLVESSNQGTDTVNVGIEVAGGTYTLGSNIENAALTSSVDYNLTGNTLNNSLTGNEASNVLDGGTGNDTLDGGAGSDTMLGGAGNDTYVVESQADVVTETVNNGTDLVNINIATAGSTYAVAENVENATVTSAVEINVVGNASNNAITGNAADNVLSGGAGNDTLNGGAGTDVMIGGAGNDTFVVAQTTDVVVEAVSAGTDTVQVAIAETTTYTMAANVENAVVTSSAAVSVEGNSSNNVITGNAADNTLSGGAGNDKLDGGAGADKLIGGAGNDTYVVDNAADKVVEAVSAGTDQVSVATATAGGSYTVEANVENASLTNTVNFDLTGNSSNNVLTGNVANNVIDGGAGADVMAGGGGNDTYVVDSTADTVIETASAGTDTVQVAIAAPDTTYTVTANVENATVTSTVATNLTGNELANTLVGNSAANVLNGGAGVDTLIGGAGNDTYVIDTKLDDIIEAAGPAGGVDTVVIVSALVNDTYAMAANLENAVINTGGDFHVSGNDLGNLILGNEFSNIILGNYGDDSLMGGLGNDSLSGGLGNDILNGGVGADLLSGGTGNDKFVFSKLADLGKSLGTADSILDFTNGDKIDLTEINDFMVATTGRSLSFVEELADPTVSLQGTLWFDNGALYLNSTGQTDSIYMIKLVDVSHLTGTDIIYQNDMFTAA